MQTKRKSAGGSLVELIVIVVVALGLALGIQAFLVKPYRIPSESMVPTLSIDQRVLVNRIGNNFSDPQVGDVMVFHPPSGATSSECGVRVSENELCPRPSRTRADVNFIKRVVAGPGDRLQVRNGRAIVNGKPLDEPYIRECAPGGGTGCDFPGEITIPADHWFMMGDNRGASDDSRFWGPVPRKWFIGGAFATYWPPNKIGLL